MIESLRSQFEERMNRVLLHKDTGSCSLFGSWLADTTDRMNLLQRDILALEEEITNLATDLVNYRECVFHWLSQL